MRRILVMLALACAIPSHAQKVPSTLENPATPELSLAYHDTYRDYNNCLIGAGVGAGVTAAGIIVTAQASKAGSDANGETIGGGNGMGLVFGYIITLAGGLETLGCLGGRVLCKNRMVGLRCKNEFMNMSGGNLESWNSNKTARVFDQSGKWMKVSAIATGGIAALYSVGQLALVGEYDDNIYRLTKGVYSLVVVGALTNIASTIVNASAARHLQVAPVVAAEPFTGSTVVGLGLAARF